MDIWFLAMSLRLGEGKCLFLLDGYAVFTPDILLRRERGLKPAALDQSPIAVRSATPSRPGSAPPCSPSACTCTPCTQPMVWLYGLRPTL